MGTFTRTLSVAAALCLSMAARAQHAGHHSTAAAAPRPAPAGTPAARDGTHYRSSFAEYRPFSGDVALKDWAKANDEVREAGGHVGLLKAEPARQQGHGAHGAKQQTSPARQK